MRRTALLITAVAMSAALAGCGSSSTSTTAASTAAKTTTGTQPSLKADTTPKWPVGNPEEAAALGNIKIALRNISIQPAAIRVQVGSIITWTNYDPIVHNVTLVSGQPQFASGPIQEGQSYTIVANAPVVIHYLDTHYPTTMNGTIEVLPREGPSGKPEQPSVKGG